MKKKISRASFLRTIKTEIQKLDDADLLITFMYLYGRKEIIHSMLRDLKEQGDEMQLKKTLFFIHCHTK